MVKILLQIILTTNIKNLINCKWITYLSATSVYGDHKGDWVNEKVLLNLRQLMGIK